MIERVIDTGNTGQLRIRDNTDNPDLMTIEFWARSSSPVSIPQMPWAYTFEGQDTNWRSYNFQSHTDWQRLLTFFVPQELQFVDYIFHLGNTNTDELGGPTDLAVTKDPTPQAMVNVRVDGVYKKAIPWVRISGEWKQAKGHVRNQSIWTPMV